jgi:hypothetical protein
MSTFGRHDGVGVVRAECSCLALCPVTYKSVPFGHGRGYTAPYGHMWKRSQGQPREGLCCVKPQGKRRQPRPWGYM